MDACLLCDELVMDSTPTLLVIRLLYITPQIIAAHVFKLYCSDSAGGLVGASELCWGARCSAWSVRSRNEGFGGHLNTRCVALGEGVLVCSGVGINVSK